MHEPCLHVDSHAHLDVAEFDPDRDAVIARAREAGIRYLLLIADLTKPESIRRISELSEQHPDVFWAAGVDPHQAASAGEEQFELLPQIVRHPRFRAIGEIGLDYFYDYPRDVQQRVFSRQLDLARELGTPVIIHCRDAWEDLRRIVHQRSNANPEKAHVARPAAAGRSGILHCFTGTLEDAADLIDIGFYVSFAGNLTFKKTHHLRATAASIPLDRILSETDSPYLAPLPHRGRRNEPAFVVEVTRELARIRGLTEAEMGARITSNFAGLFQLERPD